jgi:hypothetical protein
MSREICSFFKFIEFFSRLGNIAIEKTSVFITPGGNI